MKYLKDFIIQFETIFLDASKCFNWKHGKYYNWFLDICESWLHLRLNKGISICSKMPIRMISLKTRFGTGADTIKISIFVFQWPLIFSGLRKGVCLLFNQRSSSHTYVIKKSWCQINIGTQIFPIFKKEQRYWAHSFLIYALNCGRGLCTSS
jgi:hypothetical protein